MARPHLAALLEDAWNRRKSDALRERGWGTKIVPHTGYGSVGFVRVLARVLMSRDPMRTASGDAGGSVQSLKSADDETRGLGSPSPGRDSRLGGSCVSHGTSGRSAGTAVNSSPVNRQVIGLMLPVCRERSVPR